MTLTPLTNLGAIVGATGKFSSATALAYGTQDDVDALLVGSTFVTDPAALSSTSWLLLANHTTPLTRLANYAGDAPTSVVFDDRHAARYYVADGTKLWTNVDATTNTTFTDLSPNLASLNLTRPTAVEFISHNGVNALLVGALSTVAGSASPLAVADSPTPDQLVNWRRFGNGIPNTIIGQLSYNPLYDVLAVGTFGRGAFLLYDVTTYFASATKLVYGAADNDSNPDAIWLTGNRPLEKVGTGTLTIAGTAAYTGSTTVSGGTLLANGSLVSSSGLTVGPAGTVRGTGMLPTTAVFGTIWPGNNAAGHAVGQRQPRLRSGQQLRRRRGGQRPERQARRGRRHVDRRRQRIGLRGAGRLRPALAIHDPEFGGRRDAAPSAGSTPACRRLSCSRAWGMTPRTCTSTCRSAALPRWRRRPRSSPWGRRSMPPRPMPPATSPPS